MKVCNIAGCPTLFDGKGGRCPAHATQARRERVGNRVYSSRGHRTFRDAVLTRDVVCVIDGCVQWATVADHYPRDRKTLVGLGLNPNDPAYGRGLCHQHHSLETAQYQPGGWNA